MKKTLNVMKGLPAAGKTSYTHKMLQKDPNLVRVSRDDIRSGLQIKSHGAREMITTRIEHAQVRSALSNNKNVVIDATNLNPSVMRGWASMAKEFGAMLITIFLDVPTDVCVKRDASRPTPVGEDVITSMSKRYEKQLT